MAIVRRRLALDPRGPGYRHVPGFTVCLLSIFCLLFSSAAVFGDTKIAPTKASPGHPFTVIDTKNRRLVDGSTAVFRLQDFEFVVPLRTHKPFNTAQGRLTNDMYSGTYSVLVRQPSGLEFDVGSFSVYGAPPPPAPLLYDFNESVYAGESIGVAGGSIGLDDGYGAFFTLDVPAGAVAAETGIVLTSVASVGNVPAGFRVLTAVRLQPTGLAFGNSPRLIIDLPAGSRSGYPAVGFLSNDDGTGLTFLPLSGADPVAASLSDPQVSVMLAHFSVAGVAEAGDSAAFPPVPLDATAEERAMYSIAVRWVELFEIGAGFIDDQQMADALYDWFSNLDDGLAVRAEQAGDAADDLAFESVHTPLIGEATRLLEQARKYLTGSQLELLEVDVLEAMSDLMESYRLELTDYLCEDIAPEAQMKLNDLKTLISDFDNRALKPDFADESFYCRYQVVFSQSFHAAFTNLPLEITYDIVLNNGDTYLGSFQDLSDEFALPPVRIEIQNGTIVLDDPSFLVTPELIGPASITVEIADSPESTVDILWLPSFLGVYAVTGSGTASGCIDDYDAGAGGGAFAAVAPNQSLIFASESSARIQFTLVAPRLTSFFATVDLPLIDVGRADGYISGVISYAYEEYDAEDQRTYWVVGGGEFSGTIEATKSVRIAYISYSGSSNWCTAYAGTGMIVGQGP